MGAKELYPPPGMEYRTYAVRFPADLSTNNLRLLVSYDGSRRVAYNWVLDVVKANLDQRAAEKSNGTPDADLTPVLSWSYYSLKKLWNSVKEERAPWWREVSKHAFESGISDAARALDAWSKSRRGLRKGRRAGWPRYKKRGQPQRVTFVELNQQAEWFHPGLRHIRLPLPQGLRKGRTRERLEQLSWIKVGKKTTRLLSKIEAGTATVQQVTVKQENNRWWVSVLVRELVPVPVPTRRRQGNGRVGIDRGVKELLVLSKPIPGFTDSDGKVPNPRYLERSARKLARAGRAYSRKQKGSQGQKKAKRRLARLHGLVAQQRRSYLHQVSSQVARHFSMVVVEDLNILGMLQSRCLARVISDASMGELGRQLEYKTRWHGGPYVEVDRFYPSSKRCSNCGSVRAKLSLSERIYQCDVCGLRLDRDVNAARNLEAYPDLNWDRRQAQLARLRPESLNDEGDPRRPGPVLAGIGELVSQQLAP